MIENIMQCWPQYAVIGVMGWYVVDNVGTALNEFKFEDRVVGLVVTIVATLVWWFVLWRGGFWAVLS